jgi:hypothetical protein
MFYLGIRWSLVVSLTLRPFYPRGKGPCTDWIYGFVGPRADLDIVEKRKISCPC